MMWRVTSVTRCDESVMMTASCHHDVTMTWSWHSNDPGRPPPPHSPNCSLPQLLTLISRHWALSPRLIRSLCPGPGHVITLDQSEAWIQAMWSLSSNQRPVSWYSDYSGPIRGQYSGHVISLGQSEALWPGVRCHPCLSSSHSGSRD